MKSAAQRPPVETGGAEGDALRQHHSTTQPRPNQVPINCSADETTTLAAALHELTALLPSLRDALSRAQSKARVEPLALRVAEVAAALGVSRRILERERSAGRFPPPDLHVGRVPLYQAESIRA